MSIEQRLREECEKGYAIGPAAVAYLSVTGETFTELCGAHPQVEGGEIVYLTTLQEAYDAALAAFKAYAIGKSGTLYWRVHPELSERDGKFAFYMRLLISDMPAIKPSTV